ncbi:MAG: hypothetical protein U9N46_10315 [Euryarchaeota archaeon]|nr:hypothetical protein [Euryarchaeota archaeon]
MNKQIAAARAFMERRSRPIATTFFAASGTLLAIVLLTIACMIMGWQSPVRISLDKLALLGLHVYIFFSVGRKLWR